MQRLMSCNFSGPDMQSMCAKARHKPLHPPPAATGSVFVVAKIQIPLGQCTTVLRIKSNHLYDLTSTVRYVCLLSSDIQYSSDGKTHIYTTLGTEILY